MANNKRNYKSTLARVLRVWIILQLFKDFIIYIRWIGLHFTKKLWVKEVLKCQKEITGLKPPEYQQDKFGGILWWWYIPSWLIDKSKRKQRINCLDVGVGHGTLFLFSKKLFKGKIHGLTIDYDFEYLSKSALKELEKRYHTAQITLGNIELEDFPEWKKHFDVILMTEVIEHLHCNLVNTLCKVKEMLTDNGSIYVSSPCADYCGKERYYSSWKDLPSARPGLELYDRGHVYHYGKDEMIEIIGLAGLKIKKLKFGPKFSFGRRHFNLELIKK